MGEPAEQAMQRAVDKASGGLPGRFFFAAALIMVASLRLYSYPLFHAFAELISVVIAATYAVVAWHTRKRADGSPISALGVAYFFVAVLDTVHALAYQGMGIFIGYGYPANQVWVVARFVEAGALCFFPYLDLRKPAHLRSVLIVCAFLTVGGLASIFVFRVFPACFVAGSGQTSFKVAAEIVIVSVLAGASINLRRQRSRYSDSVYRMLQASIALTVFSELSFMVYASNFDLLNLAGHLLKIVSFYLVYRAVLVTCLENPLELLFGELQKAMSALSESNEAKDSFISVLSHDLRGPLSGIAMIAEGSLIGLGSDTAYDRRVLSEIAAAAGSSLRLVERVLAWARSRGGDLSPDLRGIDAADAVELELETLSKAAEGKGVSLNFERGAPASARADADMFGVIIRNLIQNAIKFTPRGGSVFIAVSVESDLVRVSVSDTGVGMDDAALARIFDPSTRGTTPGTDGEKGSGFGLVLCSEFAARMGGALTVHSAPGMGSSFALALPRAAES